MTEHRKCRATTYCHGYDKVGGALVEPEHARHGEGGDVGDERLHDEDDGNDGELGQLLGRQLGGELGKDCKDTGSAVVARAGEAATH